MVTRYLYITGTPDPTDTEIAVARFAVRYYGWARARLHVLVGNGYGLDPHVIGECQAMNIPYTVAGKTARPRMPLPMSRYVRVIDCPESYMRAMAHLIIDIHDGQGHSTYQREWAYLNSYYAAQPA